MNSICPATCGTCNKYVNNCVDKLPNCKQFQNTLCLNSKMQDEMLDKCPLTCDLCDKIKTTTITFATPLQPDQQLPTPPKQQPQLQPSQLG